VTDNGEAVGLREVINMEKENRPWGSYKVISFGNDYKVKKITVKPLQRLSYQSHKFRRESWTITKGTCVIILNDKRFDLKYGDNIEIPIGAKHRIINETSDNVEFIEVQTGTYFGEDDIIRYEDDYNRK